MLKSKIRKFSLAVMVTAGLTGLQLTAALAQASSPSEIEGVWETEEGDFKFEVFDAGGSFAARVIYGDRLMEADGKTFRKDIYNPDPKLRSRSLEGITFLTNLKWDPQDRRWEDGNFYDGSSGRTYSGRASIRDGALELRGYAGTPLLGRTMVLYRAP
ncbi:DUF2147 domain-containing protein [Rhizobium leguminosarum]|uniref:DUF2147 domain-containing protein n=1 Tax=Rhizobium leguminosarum TaxID=384 RepID=UPI001C9663D3|nr:DUF2147 domain-containing protein [Rhizobium leguminosarum]